MVKNPPARAGNIRDVGSIAESGKSPGEGHGNPVNIHTWEITVDRGARQATVHRVIQSWTQLKQLSMHHSISRVHVCHQSQQITY